ncbi:MAG TPA: hypothetical protein VFF79_11030 [Conexibacter sp.]|jgi:hypothetical protein|nr:hypothetical protein [Conexibacter sp.]
MEPPFAGLCFDVDIDLTSPRAPAMLVLVAFKGRFILARRRDRLLDLIGGTPSRD